MGTLALGIGVTTAVFSVVDGVLLSPLPYAAADELVMVWESGPDEGLAEASVSFPNLEDWQRQTDSLGQLGGYQFAPFALSGVAEPERLWGLRVTPTILPTLGVEPQLGRLPSEREGRPGAEPVVVLSDGLWQRRFGADPAIVGSTLELDGKTHTVVGVMPGGFAFPPPIQKGTQSIDIPAQLWVPVVPGETERDREQRVFFALGRLAPGISAGEAQTEIEGVAARLGTAYPDENRGWSARVVPLRDQVVRHVRPSLWLLFGAVLLVLVLVCCNVACLFLARGVDRRRELAVRSALGGGRRDLVALLLREGLLLGGAGGALGLGLAWLLLGALRVLAPADLPRLAEVGIDLRVVAFAAGVAIVTSLIVSIGPGLRLTDRKLVSWLSSDAGIDRGGGKMRWRGRGLLVSVELMLAVALVVAVGLTARSFLALVAVDPGFSPDRLLALEVQLPPEQYPDAADVLTFGRQAEERIAGLPGVESVGTINFPPFAGYYIRLFVTVEDQPPPDSAAQRPMVQYRVVSPDYLETVSTGVVDGRGLQAADDASAARVALVNQTAARRFWPSSEVLGRRLGLQPLAPMVRGGSPGEEVFYRVVGVVEDTKQQSLDEEPEAMVYVPLAQDPWPLWSIVARTAGPPDRLMASVRREIASLDPALAVADLRTLMDSVQRSTAGARFLLSLLSGFSLLAVVLAAVGLYGVVSSLVSQRRRELGIRLALGGSKGGIVRLLIADLGPAVLVGLVAGLALAAALSRALRSQLYEVGVADPTSFAAAAAIMGLAALASVGWPVWRILREDPIAALRTR